MSEKKTNHTKRFLLSLLLGAIPLGILFILILRGGNSDVLRSALVLQVLLSLYLLVSFVVFLIWSFVDYLHKKKQENIRIKDQEAKRKFEMRYLWHCGFKHTNGLPVAKNAWCDIFVFEDKLLLESCGVKFNLLFSKVKRVDKTTDIAIQKSYTSSAGGALSGAILFGAIGAMIGGMSTERTSNVAIHYLIITYDRDGILSYIAFELGLSAVNRNADRLMDEINGKVENLSQVYDL